jgi:hypothetical protein
VKECEIDALRAPQKANKHTRAAAGPARAFCSDFVSWISKNISLIPFLRTELFWLRNGTLWDHYLNIDSIELCLWGFFFFDLVNQGKLLVEVFTESDIYKCTSKFIRKYEIMLGSNLCSKVCFISEWNSYNKWILSALLKINLNTIKLHRRKFSKSTNRIMWNYFDHMYDWFSYYLCMFSIKLIVIFTNHLLPEAN